MKLSRRLFFACACLFFGFTAAEAQTLSKIEKWKQPAYFKGFNISPWNNIEDRMVTQQDFYDLKATGANLAIIQSSGIFNDTPPYTPVIWYADGVDTTFYIDILDEVIRFARNAEISYVISIRSGPGRIDVADEELINPSTIWTNSSEQRLYASMLNQMISRYLLDTLCVGIDLDMEPNPRMDLDEETPAVLAAALLADGIDVNALYTLWIDSVRTIDADLPLMVQGVHMSDPEYFSLMGKQSDTNIVYKVHCYNPAEYSHEEAVLAAVYPGTYWNNPFESFRYYNRTFLRDTVYAPVRDFQNLHNVPVLIGEFGLQVHQQGGEQYLDDIASIGRELGWHYALWNFNNGVNFIYQNRDSTFGTHYWSTILDFMKETPAVTERDSAALMNITSWAYQLQNINISQIAGNSTFELIVMDYSADGSDQNKFTPADISQIKNSGKKAVSYISIGEAESYRYYWDDIWLTSAPSWLGPENPDWVGNYKVRFWETEWQNIIFDYIDTIYTQGFDGIYLDIIDAYYYWSVENPVEPRADSLMVQFILNIRDHISGLTGGNFYIIPQNGEFIIEEENVSAALKTSFFSAIDGIGVEDVFFTGDLDENNPYSPDSDRLNVLAEFITHGKNVFSVEYITDAGLIQQYLTANSSYNFVPYTAMRNLDTLNDGISVSVGDNGRLSEESYKLFQNYPNPFNPETEIQFTITAAGHVELIVYNILGQKVATLVNDYLRAGNYSTVWNAGDAASGVYFYTMQTEHNIITQKMVYIK